MEKMDNTVDSILGMMEGIVDSAKIFPMTHGKVLIDQEQFLDMLADLRSPFRPDHCQDLPYLRRQPYPGTWTRIPRRAEIF